MTAPAKLVLNYEGSVKKVWKDPEDPDHLYFQFTDDYSVFDWGKMPDQIVNKGRALTITGAYFFEELSKVGFWKELPLSPHLTKYDPSFLQKRWQHPIFSGEQGLSKQGLHSHYEGLVNVSLDTIRPDWSAEHANSFPEILMKVKKAAVHRPHKHRILNENIYFYDHFSKTGNSLYLVPLEIVFRFGMSEGSSLAQRFATGITSARHFGFSGIPERDTWFPYPIIEFFTKLELKDRLLGYQEAALLSGLSASAFEELCEFSLDIALALHHLFAERELMLWDGKLEFCAQIEPSISPNSQSDPKVKLEPRTKIILADSIGPDELRLIYKGQQISKEFIRKQYRETAWAKAIELAQTLASTRTESSWKDICRDELKAIPLPLPDEIKSAIDLMYGSFANHVMRHQVFAKQISLDELVTHLEEVVKGQALC